jgi:hypothetical protein
VPNPVFSRGFSAGDSAAIPPGDGFRVAPVRDGPDSGLAFFRGLSERG